MDAGRTPENSTISHDAGEKICCLPSPTIRTRSGIMPSRVRYTTRLVTGSTSSLTFLCSNKRTLMAFSIGSPSFERQADPDGRTGPRHRARGVDDFAGERQHPPGPRRYCMKDVAGIVEKQELAGPLGFPYGIQVDERGVVFRPLRIRMQVPFDAESMGVGIAPDQSMPVYGAFLQNVPDARERREAGVAAQLVLEILLVLPLGVEEINVPVRKGILRALWPTVLPAHVRGEIPLRRVQMLGRNEVVELGE